MASTSRFLSDPIASGAEPAGTVPAGTAHTGTALTGAALPTAVWRRSSYSTAANNCVETAPLEPGRLAVRDSKDPLGPVLGFSPDAWTSFVRAVCGRDGAALTARP
ncbi:DUF397 domain-containing protein [Actinacidiphila sp. DG2A-62]|jgi:hypothetical protein|uniref:DUF397 domain-containing protein n=1 Tax=Actinacidiphila sp. DG2A-62 TaxID=3108821 RepID=UPI002DB8C7C9|nr:DUF397 domain-containing protein [Actinacidiphila sp. DG2A-62]MEC3992241.1 DUF397 domain-containing protein [Actinacidiphila sp. DG2A-62]